MLALSERNVLVTNDTGKCVVFNDHYTQGTPIYGYHSAGRRKWVGVVFFKPSHKTFYRNPSNKNPALRRMAERSSSSFKVKMSLQGNLKMIKISSILRAVIISDHSLSQILGVIIHKVLPRTCLALKCCRRSIIHSTIGYTFTWIFHYKDTLLI